MSRLGLGLVVVLLSSAQTLRAQSNPDDPPPEEPLIKVMGSASEEDKPAAKTSVKPTATIAAPKKGRPKVKNVKTAKGKADRAIRREAVVTTKAPDVSPEPKAPPVPPVPAVPLTPIAPRNP